MTQLRNFITFVYEPLKKWSHNQSLQKSFIYSKYINKNYSSPNLSNTYHLQMRSDAVTKRLVYESWELQ